jgi:hypothetical protein
MKCTYCGKEIKNKFVGTYVDGKLVSTFCNSRCMGEAYKKMTRLIKKMGRDKLLKLIDTIKEEKNNERIESNS